MKTGFNDPAKPKKEIPKCSPVDGKNTAWDFRAPEYDQRSSQFVSAGCSYGVGHAQPVGSKMGSNKDVVPMGRVETEQLYPESMR